MQPEQFAAAYERHRAALVRYCARRVGDAAAEDVAQQVWCEAWAEWDWLRERAGLNADHSADTSKMIGGSR